MGPISRAALFVTAPGLLAFILGIIAENKKPEDTAIQVLHQNGLIACNYPSDPTVVLGSLSVFLLFTATCIAIVALVYPYEGKQLPHAALWSSTLFVVFFVLTLAIYFAAEALLMWATITEAMHTTQNKHFHLGSSCPTAKTGLFGGAAFLALDCTLFWLICLMLLNNAREDHFKDDAEFEKGTYAEIPYTADPAFVSKV